MSLEPGASFGHYTIDGLIGKGGMGEVYRARDTKLGRDVAIKVLPEELARNKERSERFEREARLLAQLNHQNIATLHGLEEHDGQLFLIMEIVEGETLAERIARGPIPVDEALSLFIQIAEGLEAAHEKGIVHRDLKPANIKITPEGQIKILDFGLAKAFSPEQDATAEASQSPTLTKGTALGAILGTAAYMSPEQARGKAVDKRTDVWAFGCCLYEALTGSKAFDGETAGDTLSLVLQREPDWTRLPNSLPSMLSRLLRRCFEKDARRRVRDVGDARIDLEVALTATPALEERAPRRLPPLVAALSGAIVTGLIFWIGGVAPSSVPGSGTLTRTSISLPDGQRQPRLMSAPLAISPDGTLLAYVAQDGTGPHLFLRPLASFETRKVPGTEYARSPFFSPDGQWVGFYALGKLKKVSVARGTSLTIARANTALGASWGPDNTIVFVPGLSAGLWRVSADGGPAEQLTKPDFAEKGFAHTWPQHLPDGRHVLFSFWGTSLAPRVLDLETGDWRIARAGLQGGDRYLASGHLVYSDIVGGGFLAAPFDLKELAIDGTAVPVLDDVRFFGVHSARPFIAISRTGTAVYVTDEIGETTLLWVDRQGVTDTIRSQEGAIAGVRLSPDGETVVFGDLQGKLWTLDLKRGSVDLLGLTNAREPLWHPDGQHVTASSIKAGSWDLYTLDVVERGEARALLVREFDQIPKSWSADGRLLAYLEEHPETGTDIWVLPRGGEDPVPVLRTEANEFSPVLSPDGRFLAYVSDQSGRYQVYVRSYPEGKILGVSIDGGAEPVWSRDGQELFFRHGDQLLSTTVVTDPELSISSPTVLFEMAFARAPDSAWSSAYYDVSPDGERFLIVSDRSTTEFKVIQNWFEELERLVPTDKISDDGP